MDLTLLTPILTLIGSLAVAYLSYRLGKVQVAESAKSTSLIDRTTGETEFRKSLLELIDQQEEKLTKQDSRIEKLNTQIEQGRTLTDELKRANFNLTIENERLKRLIAGLEAELQKISTEVKRLKDSKQDVIDETHK